MTGLFLLPVLQLCAIIAAAWAGSTRQLVSLPDDLSQLCPPGFQNLHSRYCYQHFTSISSWTEAWTYCKSVNTELLTIVSPEENQAVSEWIRPKAFPDKKIWLGINNMLGNWSTSRLGWQPLSYVSWDSGQPSASTARYDGSIQCAISENGLWTAISCKDSKAFVCKFEIDGLVG